MYCVYHAGELELICLGPLTNVALAIRSDASFGRKLKHCYVMGGNYEGTKTCVIFSVFSF